MIKDLSNEMKDFVKDLKDNIKNPEELKYLLERTEKFFDIVIREVEEIMNYKEKEIADLEEKQRKHGEKIDEMSEKMKTLCKDIYDEDYEDFEIICPYCNYEFDADIDETSTEVVCPECNNVIELDWDGDPDDIYLDCMEVMDLYNGLEKIKDKIC